MNLSTFESTGLPWTLLKCPSDQRPRRCRLLAVGTLDLLELWKLHKGIDHCDDFEDRRDALLVLPAAIAEAEKRTGKTIGRKCYEITSPGDLPCEIRLAHPPIRSIECFQIRDAVGEWIDVPHEWAEDLEGVNRTVRVCDRDALVCECRCPCRCQTDCDCEDRWRIRYTTGATDCAIPISADLLRLVFAIADHSESPTDDGLAKYADRLVQSCKIHSF